ncbi:similar to Saccharomyces cerevisiae YBL011W SCT1 Glycerol 3-phosphate/dihydroxyacetone phosphate dual substrate-specific sn-1 acyltransferase of the glycerolipid biosynthesis pathway [Maudiozyma barnettii]|uniref:Similar to Saccharomyces cerevisiae YBL011W SCT1 Glycerol 3-phosphate/dihydroxyacetone phosphate dual substrate-specific sn-1 acyltransferase of the glycerolipid biosynthesis pathway n=1 Tax=Maudiozyma barnettii TaxID=61262 RepID=A0A8H2VGK2_9SACH|nr:bifunctional glycerol-3-phosphate/glycerone-phosphate O-acyltransferase SCT1 [Kazachstania barnettii]CAB4255091.1 similar to Saccharomyces cerevisiae YBL011W SCT1 Glycerol 3-phosphate/dihydroxyacetone phosphate dual substrate-specific sn-1 acyltransferase of the glycerolipid biosynthesis pathway [Kazachstania barnettii]CAD1783362.1 similar to Saccharomyces cerevisiae YBL011W SCT1 Glycerol 3-phosphate/dihydroxyacetone phosphate dual substrate-specific sn-1 acyltransferase of the glycerolipid bi
MEKPLLSEKGKEQKKLEEEQEQGQKTGQVSSIHKAFSEYKYEEPPTVRKAFYDFMLWLLWNIFECFFREIKSRGGYRMPKEGPIIFVAAPHANQFVDPIILMEQVKKVINKRVLFLIAESSLHMKGIGFLARAVMAIGVVRPQDNLQPATGKIKVDPHDYKKVIGKGTKFLTECRPKGLIGLSKGFGNAEVVSVESDTVLYIRKEFKMNKPDNKKVLLERGTSFKYADKVDQSLVYHKVFEHLANDSCIGIFPEGGSHDRTDLLPIKAGVAIMALGCMDKHPDVNVKIVPCGMNYFHAHRFRSRAVVEFGEPIEISRDLVEKYHQPETNRDAVKTLLDEITEGLKAVTVTCKDYETLMIVQVMRRLYSTRFNRKVPLSMIVEMNRRIVKGYEGHRDKPDVKQLGEDILKYNEKLNYYNLADHSVETARVDFMTNLCLLVYRSVFITVALLLSLPGIIMFSPIFILANRVSKEKARKALAKSSVKIKANDVIATWKILISMGFSPLLYIIWSFIITYFVVLYKSYTNHYVLVFMMSYALSVLVTYSALIVGDHGMDMLKSLRPLYMSLTSPSGLRQLKKERESLTERIITTIDTLDPELLMDFESGKFTKEMEEYKTKEIRRRRLIRQKREKLANDNEGRENDEPTTAMDSDAISLVNSDNSLSNIPLFSTMVGGRRSQSGSISSSVVSSRASSIVGFSTDASEQAISEFEIDIDNEQEMTAAKTTAVSNRIAQIIRGKRQQSME